MYVMFWDYWQQAMKVQDPVIFTTQNFMVFMSFLGCFIAVPHAFHWGPSERFSKAGNPRGMAVRKIQIQVAEICSNFHGFPFPQNDESMEKKQTKNFADVFLLHTFTYLEL